MPQDEETYTYRGGQKMALRKAPDQFVVRALPERLETFGIPDAEEVSATSSKVTTRAPDLEPEMSRMRNVAPTHHAYSDPETGAEFLITDRVLITFKDALPPEQIDAFAARLTARLFAVSSCLRSFTRFISASRSDSFNSAEPAS